MAVLTYTWDLQEITVTTGGDINFTSSVYSADFHEDDADIVEETAFIRTQSGDPTKELPYENTLPPTQIAEVFGDSDATANVGNEYLTLGGVDYDYVYEGYQTFEYSDATGGTATDIFAVIRVIGNGPAGKDTYYALNLTNAGDPSNGSTGQNLTDLISGELYIRDGVVQPPPCYTAGTLILTDQGEVAVEDLVIGDRVWTMDHGWQPIRLICSKVLPSSVLQFAPHLCPVTIKAGALGDDYPSADLSVSPQHRLYIRSKVAGRMCGNEEILVPAKQLLDVPGVRQETADREVTYFHIVFDQHEIILANKTLSESFYTGKEAMKSIDKSARKELFEIFPELAEMDVETLQTRKAARPFVKGSDARKLAEQLSRSGKPFVENCMVGFLQ